MKLKKLSIITATVFLFALFVTPAFASDHHGDRHDGDDRDSAGYTVVINLNEAEVSNMVETKANTGGNWAGGSYGGDGGGGGDIKNNGDEVDESSTGNGGAGGAAGVGGTVMSGNANAETNIMNAVNENKTDIEGCGCDGELVEVEPVEQSRNDHNDWDSNRYENEDGHVIVLSANRARVINAAGTYANTGENNAEGSFGGDGGDGGDIKNGDDKWMPDGPKPVLTESESSKPGDGYHGNDGSDGEVDESSTGKGGAGGASDAGGLVQSGHANSLTNVVNMVNRNITRIRR